MNNTSLRTAALWTTIVSGVLGLCCSAGFQLIMSLGGLNRDPFGGFFPFYSLVSFASLLFNLIHTLSLLVFLGLVHRDLHIAERWAGYARDYLIRDTTGGPAGGNPQSTEIRQP